MSAFICEDGQFEAAVNGWVTHIQRTPGLQRLADIATRLISPPRYRTHPSGKLSSG